MVHHCSILLAFLAFAAVGCDPPKKPTPSPSPSASAPARPLAHFSVDPFGAAVFVVKASPGGGSEVKGIAKAFSGDLAIDLHDLPRTRGTIAVDLTKLELHSRGDEARDADETARARDFLASRPAGSSAPKRLAVFSIDSIEPSENDVSALSGNSRKVLLGASGNLEILGAAQKTRLSLHSTFVFTEEHLSQVTFRSEDPLTLDLAAFESSPRDPKTDDFVRTVLGRAPTDSRQLGVTVEFAVKPPR